MGPARWRERHQRPPHCSPWVAGRLRCGLRGRIPWREPTSAWPGCSCLTTSRTGAVAGTPGCPQTPPSPSLENNVPWTCFLKTPGSEKVLALCPQTSFKPPSGNVSHQPPGPVRKQNAAFAFTCGQMSPVPRGLGLDCNGCVLAVPTAQCWLDTPLSHKSTRRGVCLWSSSFPCLLSPWHLHGHGQTFSREQERGHALRRIQHLLSTYVCGVLEWVLGHSHLFLFLRASSFPGQSSESMVGTRARVRSKRPGVRVACG